jgi:hypothetical protein
MKRSFQCAFGTAALLLSSSAWAQDFGAKGQLTISAERLFGFTYDSATLTQGGVDSTNKLTGISLLSSPGTSSGAGIWAGYGSPRVAGDYFVIDHLSVGGALGYSHWSLNVPAPVAGANGERTVSGDAFTFAPRAGYAFLFNDVIGIWPRAGFTYRTSSADTVSEHDFALTLEVPVVVTLIPHVVFWGGPTLDLGLTGSQDTDNANGSTTSIDFNATEFGIQTGLVAYLDL